MMRPTSTNMLLLDEVLGTRPWNFTLADQQALELVLHQWSRSSRLSSLRWEVLDSNRFISGRQTEYARFVLPLQLRRDAISFHAN